MLTTRFRQNAFKLSPVHRMIPFEILVKYVLQHDCFNRSLLNLSTFFALQLDFRGARPMGGQTPPHTLHTAPRRGHSRAVRRRRCAAFGIVREVRQRCIISSVWPRCVLVAFLFCSVRSHFEIMSGARSRAGRPALGCPLVLLRGGQRTHAFAAAFLS